MKNQRYVRVTVAMLQQVGAGYLSYQEFCVLSYILVHCGTGESGTPNPYKRGRRWIQDTFQVSPSRAKRILLSLQAKGFLQPIYRVTMLDGETVPTKSLKHARALLLKRGGTFTRTFYNAAANPKFLSKKPTG